MALPLSHSAPRSSRVNILCLTVEMMNGLVFLVRKSYKSLNDQNRLLLPSDGVCRACCYTLLCCSPRSSRHLKGRKFNSPVFRLYTVSSYKSCFQLCFTESRCLSYWDRNPGITGSLTGMQTPCCPRQVPVRKASLELGF